MQRFYDVVRDQWGNAVTGASVTVYVSGTHIPATLYDPATAIAAISNPITTAADGEFAFACNDQRVDIVVSGGNFTAKTYYGIYLYDGLTGTPGTGTVTSVALSAPAEFAVAGSPVTGAGTLQLSWATATANRILAGPITGAATYPTFRALVAADIPTLNITLTMPSEFAVGGSPATIGSTLAVTKSIQAANTVWAGPSSGAAAAPAFRALVGADFTVMVASGASHAGGAVPDPGATAGTAKYLCEDATWHTPAYRWLWTQTSALTLTGITIGTYTCAPTGQGTLTIPANALKSGSIIRVKAFFYFGAATGCSFTPICKIGSAVTKSLQDAVLDVTEGTAACEWEFVVGPGGIVCSTGEWVNYLASSVALLVDVAPVSGFSDTLNLTISNTVAICYAISASIASGVLVRSSVEIINPAIG